MIAMPNADITCQKPTTPAPLHPSTHVATPSIPPHMDTPEGTPRYPVRWSPPQESGKAASLAPQACAEVCGPAACCPRSCTPPWSPGGTVIGLGLGFRDNSEEKQSPAHVMITWGGDEGEQGGRTEFYIGLGRVRQNHYWLGCLPCPREGRAAAAQFMQPGFLTCARHMHTRVIAMPSCLPL